MSSLLLGLAAATASISWTLTKTPVFDFVRRYIQRQDEWEAFYNRAWQLWTCPFCMSHYVGAFLVALYRPQPFGGGGLDYMVDVFVLSGFTLVSTTLVVLVQKLGDYLLSITDRGD